MCGALAVSGSASAASISGNGLTAGWGLDWGTYTENAGFGNHEFRYNTVTLNNSAYRSAAGVNDGDVEDLSGEKKDVTTPGFGGQDYDAEAIFYAFSGDLTGGFLSIGMFTGFNPNGEDSGVTFPADFYAGDLFIDIGNDASFDIAIAMGLGEARSGKAWGYDGSVSAEIDPYYDGSPSPDHTITAPYRLDESHGSVFEFDSTDVRTEHTLVNNYSSENQRWFYEARLYLDGGLIDLVSLTDDTLGTGIGLHWTMECGNDYIHVNDSTPLAPVVPVPAAAPMALLGMVIIGAVRRRRK